MILFNDMESINAFTCDFSFHKVSKNQLCREDVVFELVRFVPGSNDLEIDLVNIGTVNSDISTIAIVNIDNQEIITNWIDVNQPIQIKENQRITLDVIDDDENLDSVSGASIKIILDESVVITPKVVRTDLDGSAIVSLTAFEGHNISFGIIATAEVYAEGKDNFVVNVDAPEKVFDAIDLELPEWIIYIVIGGILMVGVVVFMFLRNSKTDLEEEWEEEEEEDEDEEEEELYFFIIFFYLCKFHKGSFS